MFVLGILLVVVSVALLVLSFIGISTDPGKGDKKYIDLGNVRLSCPERTIRRILSFLGGLHTQKSILSTQVGLEKAGRPYRLTAKEYLGFRLMLSAFLGLLPFLVMKDGAPYALCGVAMGWMYPSMALNGYKSGKRNDIRKDLPYAVDLLTICMGAGLGFDMSLRRVIPNLPKGALKTEFTNVMNETDMGKSRAEALKAMAARIQLPELTSLVNNVCQAEEFGTGISTTLPVMAEHIRTKSHLHAEATAAKAPVLMLFPLVCFIFPCILILLMAPLYLSGALDM